VLVVHVAAEVVCLETRQGASCPCGGGSSVS